MKKNFVKKKLLTKLLTGAVAATLAIAGLTGCGSAAADTSATADKKILKQLMKI